jgi:hypothetical protein
VNVIIEQLNVAARTFKVDADLLGGSPSIYSECILIVPRKHRISAVVKRFVTRLRLVDAVNVISSLLGSATPVPIFEVLHISPSPSGRRRSSQGSDGATDRRVLRQNSIGL